MSKKRSEVVNKKIKQCFLPTKILFRNIRRDQSSMISRYLKDATDVMLGNFTQGAAHIYFACGPTGFRKQIDGLAVLVSMKFQFDPYSPTSVFIFCNRRKNVLKVLRFEVNGFILASKKLVKSMHFQWPKDKDGLKDNLWLI